MESRKIEEMAFHDQRERDRHALTDQEYERKYSNRRWYAITERSGSYITEWLAEHIPGKVVLDYCCGLGGTSLRCAKLGGRVFGIDISPESVETARKALDDAGLAGSAHFEVMDAEEMRFPDEMFDVIICFGVLHHVDVERAFPELRRVLKPGGLIIAGEALGYNPAIALYRRLTPKLRTAWEADHILTMRELALAKRWFEGVEVRFFHLFAVLATPLRRTRVFGLVLGILNAIDDVVLRIPLVQLLAWQMVFVLSVPRGKDR